MEQQLRKPDWEYSPEIVSQKNCEIWANVDFFERNVIVFNFATKYSETEEEMTILISFLNSFIFS